MSCAGEGERVRSRERGKRREKKRKKRRKGEKIRVFVLKSRLSSVLGFLKKNLVLIFESYSQL